MEIFYKNTKLILFLFIGLLVFKETCSAEKGTKKPLQNILFFIMDDVGIDQVKSFGYGGHTPPSMPNIDQIAKAGIRFRNNWSMPACSPSRAVFFEGRFPNRTNIKAALGPSDLANSMVSPDEMTIPKLLKQRNYKSALFGKFHIGLQGNSPYNLSMPRNLGWDYYYGWLDETGDPSSIDTTAGGIGGDGQDGNGKVYSCGYIPGLANGGANNGACYTPDDKCTEMSGSGDNPPGRACRDNGGIFNPRKLCASITPLNIKKGFMNLSGHYVNPVVINHENGRIEQVLPTDKRARVYRGTDSVNEAIKWIKANNNKKPWMATVSFATVHTPLQQPPVGLLPVDAKNTNGLNCASVLPENTFPLNNQMITAMDTEIGRLLVETGLAKRRQDGSMNYDPKKTNTMIVLVGDNGSMGYTVKLPFDLTRAKGTTYQTGVWVPALVSGPMVVKPDRDVEHMTNIADIYQLFGEIAGINVQKSVPRPIDSVSMLPYLKNPAQKSIRKWNYTEGDLNIQANGAINGPCVLTKAFCSHIPVSKSVCEDNAGVWWGAHATDPSTTGIPAEGLKQCCDVNVWKAGHGQIPVSIVPQATQAIRNNNYKIVRNFTKDYDSANNACYDNTSEEFYQINQKAPIPKLDRKSNNLLKEGAPALTNQENLNYQALNKKLEAIDNSVVECPGDGNLDGVVDQKDIDEWEKFSTTTGKTTPNGGGKSSWYDFDYDGDTDLDDKGTILANMGRTCK
jgi:arylsulfatase A-like enzyme